MHRRVHHREGAVADLARHRQRPPAKPVHPVFALARLEHVIEGVALTELPQLERHHDEMQLVVADHVDGTARFDELAHPFEHTQRARSAVHDVADRVQRETILAERIPQSREQLVEFVDAALHVTHEDEATPIGGSPRVVLAHVPGGLAHFRPRPLGAGGGIGVPR